MSKLGLAAAVAALAIAPATAHAYVQTRASTGMPLRWAPGCAIPLTVYLDNLPGANPDETRAAVKAAVAAWTSESCAGVGIEVTFAPGDGPLPEKDGITSITLRPEGWCDAAGAGPKLHGICYEPFATSITTTNVIRVTGEIVEVDIQLNPHMSWRPGDDGAANLQASLTHELGHLLGFDHPCTDVGRTPVPTDDRGATVPLCDGAPAELATSVMFHRPGNHQTVLPLSADDRRGVCAIYPKASATALCPAPPAAGGCSYPAGSSRAPALAAVLALLGAALIAARARSPGRARRRR